MTDKLVHICRVNQFAKLIDERRVFVLWKMIATSLFDFFLGVLAGTLGNRT
jgi:hypothetical protein